MKCLRDFIEAQNNQSDPAGNADRQLCRLADRRLWKDFRRNFSHGIRLEISHDDSRQHEYSVAWASIIPPKLEEVLLGALSPETPDVHYVSYVRYPSYEGFGAYLNLLPKQTATPANHEL